MNRNENSTVSLSNKRSFLSIVITGIALAILLASALIWFQDERDTTWYGYVVGEDRRIYMVDLEEGRVLWVSDYLDQIGKPYEIDLNREESILYIGSGPEFVGRARGYVPLIAIQLKENPTIYFESWVDPNYDPSIEIWGEPPVYYVNYDSNSDVLYISLGSENYPSRREAINPYNADIIGHSDIFITKDHEFSPDGKRLAEIHPGLNEDISNGVGEFPGLIIVWDLESGEQVLRTEHENNANLYPPWGASSNRLVHVRVNRLFNRLEIFDRDKGELLALHEFREEFEEVGAPTQRHHATPIPGSDDVVMTFGGHLVVFDPITAEIKSQTYVSDTILTEVVVTDKPLLRTDIITFSYREDSEE